MHPEARDFIARAKTALKLNPRRVLEIGSRDVNGSIRDLWPNTEYIGIDRVAGNGVDVVVDAANYRPGAMFDLVICCEVLEHTDSPGLILQCASDALVDGGYFLLTCAAPDREPHGINGERPPRGEQVYHNISAEHAMARIKAAGLRLDLLEYWRDRGDLYAAAKK